MPAASYIRPPSSFSCPGAGYPDGNDAQTLRDDPLFQILADVAPDAERPLASASTLTRFQYAYTRRQAELPPEERPDRPHLLPLDAPAR